MTNTGLTVQDLTTLFGFGCLIGSVAFAVATKLKEAELKNTKAEMLENAGEMLDKFRVEMKADLHYFRAETDEGMRRFELNVQKALDNHKVKRGLIEVTQRNIEKFLTARFGYKERDQVDNEDLPTDFTNK